MRRGFMAIARDTKAAFLILGFFFSCVSYTQIFLQERNNVDSLLRADEKEKAMFAIPPDGTRTLTTGSSCDGINKTAEIPPPETSIIILSNLIPTHPSIDIINEAFNSISEMIDGLPTNTPIYISVDGLPEKKYTPDNIKRLHGYVTNLRMRFLNNTSVTILNNYAAGHISNSIRTALEVVQTEFIYVLQHDFKFIKHVDHTSLVNAMREYPDKLQIVRFGKDLGRKYQVKRFIKFCYNEMKAISFNNIRFESAGVWSDNNHFTTKAYYERLLSLVSKDTPIAPEFLMQKYGDQVTEPSECYFFFQYLYNFGRGRYLEHLEGRKTKSITKKGNSTTTNTAKKGNNTTLVNRNTSTE